MSDLLIIIPAYNEEGSIENVVNNIIQNYLQSNESLTEATLQQEISKDKLSLKEVLNFMKESKELFTK